MLSLKKKFKRKLMYLSNCKYMKVVLKYTFYVHILVCSF